MKLYGDLKTLLETSSAILLTVLAVTGCGDKGTATTLPLEAIAQAAARQEDRVTPEQLADWIISKRRDVHLLDIRDKQAFSDGHIEGAENIPLPALVLAENLEALPVEKKLVVYSNGSEQAAKAGVMLRLAGFDAHLLVGGYNHWQDRILNPDIPPEAADDELPEQALRRAVSCYFVAPEERGARHRSLRQAPEKSAEPKGFTPPLAPPGGVGQAPRDEGC